MFLNCYRYEQHWAIPKALSARFVEQGHTPIPDLVSRQQKKKRSLIGRRLSDKLRVGQQESHERYQPEGLYDRKNTMPFRYQLEGLHDR